MNSQVPFPHPLPPTCPDPCCRRSLPGQQGSSGSRDAQLSSPSPGSLGEAVRWTKLGWGGLFPGTEGESAASTTCPAGRRPGTVWDSRRHPLSQQETPVPCEVRAGLAAHYKVIPSRQQGLSCGLEESEAGCPTRLMQDRGLRAPYTARLVASLNALVEFHHLPNALTWIREKPLLFPAPRRRLQLLPRLRVSTETQGKGTVCFCNAGELAQGKLPGSRSPRQRHLFPQSLVPAPEPAGQVSVFPHPAHDPKQVLHPSRHQKASCRSASAPASPQPL